LIISDGWREYNRLDEIGGGIYEHQIIVHQENFVVHTKYGKYVDEGEKKTPMAIWNIRRCVSIVPPRVTLEESFPKP
jgi:hypothetical protein